MFASLCADIGSLVSTSYSPWWTLIYEDYIRWVQRLRLQHSDSQIGGKKQILANKSDTGRREDLVRGTRVLI